MNAFGDRGVDLGQNVRIGAIFAVSARLPSVVRGAIRQVLGCGNRKDASQIRDFAKDVRQSVAHPPAYRRLRRAKRNIWRLLDPCHFRAVLKERSRHRSRLVHVEIDADAESLCPLHKSS